MKYYAQYDGDAVIAVGTTTGDVPEGCTEITESDYLAYIETMHEEDEARKEERERQEEEARERMRALIQEYAQRVIDGEITIDDVPVYIREQVRRIVDPPVRPPTTTELASQLEATQEALDFILMNMEV